VAICLLLALPATLRAASTDLCPAPSETTSFQPTLILETELGTIQIDLFEDAAPGPVRTLARLTRGPLFDPALLSSGLTTPPDGKPPDATPQDAPSAESAAVAEPTEPDEVAGFYDGLVFDFTRPHVELATSTRAPSSSFTVDNELDAEALGLDRAVIEDRAQAMTVLQRELLPDFIRNKKNGTITPRLRTWLDRWSAHHSPDFLVGASRRQVNEALGFVYHSGLASRPPDRGAVALWPASPTRATLRLTIFLTDLPQRSGQWMVIGRVSRGLDVAEAISSQPLDEQAGLDDYKPVDPVRIVRATFACLPQETELPAPDTRSKGASP